MTKREKGQCSSPGCHREWNIDLVVRYYDAIIPKYFCAEHFITFIGYYSTMIYNNPEKEVFLDGIDVYKSNEDKIAANKGS